MKIVGVRIEPVAKILAIIYAIFGLLVPIQLAFQRAETVKLPLGFNVPIFYLNFNLTFPFPHSVFGAISMVFASVAVYAISGWVSGALLATMFNFVAKKIGGIDPTYFTLERSAPDTDAAARTAE